MEKTNPKKKKATASKPTFASTFTRAPSLAKAPEDRSADKKASAGKPPKKTVRAENIKKTETPEEKLDKEPQYLEGIGRRKTAVARVRLFSRGEKAFLVNDKPLSDYFSTPELRQIVISPLEKMKCQDHFRILVKVKGGGVQSQAEALRHGISRALVKFNSEFRKRLRRTGYLTRDPRVRERKKFGLKRARRAPQWQKR